VSLVCVYFLCFLLFVFQGSMFGWPLKLFPHFKALGIALKLPRLKNRVQFHLHWVFLKLPGFNSRPNLLISPPPSPFRRAINGIPSYIPPFFIWGDLIVRRSLYGVFFQTVIVHVIALPSRWRRHYALSKWFPIIVLFLSG